MKSTLSITLQILSAVPYLYIWVYKVAKNSFFVVLKKYWMLVKMFFKILDFLSHIWPTSVQCIYFEENWGRHFKFYDSPLGWYLHWNYSTSWKCFGCPQEIPQLQGVWWIIRWKSSFSILQVLLCLLQRFRSHAWPYRSSVYCVLLACHIRPDTEMGTNLLLPIIHKWSYIHDCVTGRILELAVHGFKYDHSSFVENTQQEFEILINGLGVLCPVRLFSLSVVISLFIVMTNLHNISVILRWGEKG